MSRLSGERLILREYRQEDLFFMRKWVNNPEITVNLSDIFLYPHTVNETEKYLNTMLEGRTDQKGFVIAQKDNEEYIGQIDLLNFDWKNRVVDMSIVIGDVKMQGKGYGTEARPLKNL